MRRHPDSEEAMDDPQIVHNELVHDLDDPKLGATKMLGLPLKMSGTPGRIRGARAAAASSYDVEDSRPRDTESSSSGALPLDGVRVMDMTNVIAVRSPVDCWPTWARTW